MILNENERIDDLQINGLKLIQDNNLYCFTSDAVLLANLVKVKNNSEILEIGTGCGIIAVLLAGKKNAKFVTAVEIQENLANIAKKNVKLNNLNDKINILNVSAQELINTIPAECFDIVVSNPPYGKINAGDTDKNETRAICKYEIKLNLAELIEIAARNLKYGGKFYMVHPSSRMAECIFEMKKNKIEPKIITLVYPKAEKTADTIIYECVKGGASGLKINKLVVYDENGEYTAEAKRLYSKD